MSQAPPIPLPTEQDETAQAQALARQVSLGVCRSAQFRIRHEVLRSVPVDMMFRYKLCAAGAGEDRLVIAVSDPSKLMIAGRNQRPAGAADCNAGWRRCRRSPIC